MLWLCILFLGVFTTDQGLAAAGLPTNSVVADDAAMPHFNVRGFTVEGRWVLSTNVMMSLFSKYAGTNVALGQVLQAAAELDREYLREGYPAMNVAIAPRHIANGIVTLNIFPGAVPQIIVAGRRYLVSSNGVQLVMNAPLFGPGRPTSLGTASESSTNQLPTFPAITPLEQLGRPATPEEMARAYAALTNKMSELSAKERDTRIHVASTNAGPRFTVANYQVEGNSILPPATLATIFTNIDGAYGTNVSLDGIRTVATELKKAYRARGFVTVDVTLPPQKLTNATVKIQVTEGRLNAILVKGNHFYSTENIMRALPSLHTNMILNGEVFEAELNRANANQDRQIYPAVDPGPEPGTSDLTLTVKDRLPLHGKVDLDNQNSPGTPELRVNASAVYDNLWQLEHSLGVQYGFSPEEYKTGSRWDFFDQPQVANYSAFYRMPLGNPDSIGDLIAGNSGGFGYDEATHKFNLPPASGQPELNFFASRSTMDSGLTTTPSKTLFSSSVTNSDASIVTNSTLKTTTSQQDLTVNGDMGFRLTMPLPSSSDFHSSLSGGLDFKTYQVTSAETNNFYLNVLETAYNTPPVTIPITSTNYSEVPYTTKNLRYLPISMRYDGDWRDALGRGFFGLGMSANTWLSGVTTIASSPTNVATYTGVKSLQEITGSKQSSAYWVTLSPSLSHTFEFVTNWVTTVRADGQWASQPLISNEQFGIGGVNSVRGYHEGEVFGDTGWHVTVEEQTPPYLVGTVSGRTPVTVRGTVYMDYARVYLLDPQGRDGSTSLADVGIGGVASIGSHWQARLLVSVPLMGSSTVVAYEPYFNFMLTAQF